MAFLMTQYAILRVQGNSVPFMNISTQCSYYYNHSKQTVMSQCHDGSSWVQELTV